MAAPIDVVSFKSINTAAIINGAHTDLVCRRFQDSFFIIATQYEKLGTIIQVERESLAHESHKCTYNTKVLLGKEQMELEVLARNITEQLDTSITIALALKDHSVPAMKAVQSFIITTINENRPKPKPNGTGLAKC